MLNNIVLVGKIVEKPVLKSTNGGIPFANLSLQVERGMQAGENSVNDVFHATCWRLVATEAIDKVEVGDMVGLKGRIQVHNFTTVEGKSYTNYDIIAEKITILN